MCVCQVKDSSGLLELFRGVRGVAGLVGRECASFESPELRRLSASSVCSDPSPVFRSAFVSSMSGYQRTKSGDQYPSWLACAVEGTVSSTPVGRGAE